MVPLAFFSIITFYLIIILEIETLQTFRSLEFQLGGVSVHSYKMYDTHQNMGICDFFIWSFD